MKKLLRKEWVFAIVVFILMNLASIADKDFFNWKMNIGFMLFVGIVYIHREV
jgi:hypothetical protein